MLLKDLGTTKWQFWAELLKAPVLNKEKTEKVCEVQGACEPDSVTVLSGGVERIRILLLEVSESYLNAWPKLNNVEAMLPSSYYENFRPAENRMMEANIWKNSFYDLTV